MSLAAREAWDKGCFETLKDTPSAEITFVKGRDVLYKHSEGLEKLSQRLAIGLPLRSPFRKTRFQEGD